MKAREQTFFCCCITASENCLSLSCTISKLYYASMKTGLMPMQGSHFLIISHFCLYFCFMKCVFAEKQEFICNLSLCGDLEQVKFMINLLLFVCHLVMAVNRLMSHMNEQKWTACNIQISTREKHSRKRNKYFSFSSQ